MSLPSFPSDGRPTGSRPPPILSNVPSSGAGDHLPVWLLALCGAFTAVATAVSVMSITLQLKNYRKPALQRSVVRIMVMVPLYAISSLIALFSLEAAFFIDAVRDLYEAFVIYTFFQLLITYLGGERSLLIILHGRPPIPHPFPFNIFLRPMDVSDPWTLLNLKRGVLQYVQIKPLLVVATVILKATGTYREGEFAADSGYTYISIVYNTSICLSLYCLAMFWVCVNSDLKPFRPVPKFLCVKGILFFSFWQSIGISFLVAVKAIKRVGEYTDPEHMSLALVDSLICFEMPIFAIAHQYAFQASDYIDEKLVHAARLPFVYAFRDAFGLKDVWEDTKDTLKGRGVSYQAYEPAEGALHHGHGRQKRIRAGLRYSRGGKAKYWIPMPGDESRNIGDTGPIAAIKRRVDKRLAVREGYAPLLPAQADQVIHDDPELGDELHHGTGLFDSDSDDSDAASLDFDSVDEEQDTLYERARRIGYAGFPNVDVSREAKRRKQREEEDGILAGKRSRGQPGQLRRPVADQQRSHSGNAGRKGKAKEAEPRKAVYGAWADRIASVDKEDSTVNGDGDRLQWNKKVNGQSNPPSPPRRDSAASPFTLGEDEDSIPSGAVSPSDRALPSDARDLVIDDDDMVEEARTRGRIRGEPQTGAPAHVYVHQDARQHVQEVEEVYEDTQIGGGRRTSEALDPDDAPHGDVVQELQRIDEDSPSGIGGLTNAGGGTCDDEVNPWA